MPLTGSTPPRQTQQTEPSMSETDQNTTLRPAHALMAALPALAAILAAPMALVAGKVLDRAEAMRFFAPQGMGMAAALAALALLFTLVQGALADKASATGDSARNSRRPSLLLHLGLGLAVGALALYLFRHYGPRLAQAQNLAPLLDELKLPALALFTALWVFQFGAPSRATIARAGALLGAVVLLDFLLSAITARGLVLGGGLLFGGSPGTQDLLAVLLNLALCATLDDDPETSSPLASLPRWLILGGLFAGFSRAGLATTGLLLLMAGRGPLRTRLALVCTCALLVWMTLALPLHRMDSGSDDLGLSWYFAATVEALGQNPSAPFFGLPLSEPLAQAVSEDWLLPGLDAEGMGLSVAIFEIPSSALRLLAAWGAGGPVLVVSAALLLALPARSRFGYGLIAALLVCGALTPALHTPATAWALCLCLAAARQDGRQDGRRKLETAPDGN